MPAQTDNLFLLQDLEDRGVTNELTDSDLNALRTVADWITTFVAKPHKDLGREGPVCPFVPEALDRKSLWLASEHIDGRSVADVVQRITGYKTLFLNGQPVTGEGTNYKSIVVVFPDLLEDRAKGFFDEVLKHLAAPSYVQDGLVLGAFYKRNEATAIHSRDFRPFTPPVPFLLVRQAVITDWKFFLDDESWLDRWAHRYGGAAVTALAQELRRLPWRTRRD